MSGLKDLARSGFGGVLPMAYMAVQDSRRPADQDVQITHVTKPAPPPLPTGVPPVTDAGA